MNLLCECNHKRKSVFAAPAPVCAKTKQRNGHTSTCPALNAHTQRPPHRAIDRHHSRFRVWHHLLLHQRVCKHHARKPCRDEREEGYRRNVRAQQCAPACLTRCFAFLPFSSLGYGAVLYIVHMFLTHALRPLSRSVNQHDSKVMEGISALVSLWLRWG